MTKELKKPKKQSKEYWDYDEVAKYVSKKLGYDLRDVAGKYKGKHANYEEIPYLDFWHWLIENTEIHNGGSFYLPEPEWVKAEPWVLTILQEFYDIVGDDEMEVWW